MISDTERRQVLRQLDRDVDAKFKIDQLDQLSDDLYPSHEPSPFWTFMEGKTDCPECGSVLNIVRLCDSGCLDDLALELDGDPRVGGIPGTRTHRGWLRT